MTRKIELNIYPDDISLFNGILTYGVIFYVNIGRSLIDVLYGQIGIAESYLNQRVQTIFLNHRVVDNIYTETVTDGSVIALSAAMPGLFGAVVRRDGALALMRTTYHVRPESKDPCHYDGHVVLKLFNLIASELGKGFLENGIYMKEKDLVSYVQWKRTQFEAVCTSCIIDDHKAEIDEILNFDRQDENVFLRLHYL